MNSDGNILVCLFVIFAGVELSVSQRQRLPPIRPIAFRLPPVPALVGPLAVNDGLSKAEKLHQNLLKGPSTFASNNGSLYTGTLDNKIYDIAACPPQLVASLSPPGCKSLGTCGLLNSIRMDPTTGKLLALVNAIGLIEVDTSTGNTTTIYSAKTSIKGRLPVYLTDFVVMADGTIILADASDSYSYPNDIYICQDSRPTSRLLAISRGTGTGIELLANTFVHPTSLELASDGSLLVSEACRARIRRVSLQRPTLLKVTDFSPNLPGVPDNIRATNHGTYWVALRYSRHSSLRTNPLDFYAQRPNFRLMGTRFMNRQSLENTMNPWSIIVEVNQNGKPVASFHDSQGSAFRNPTEAHEFNGILYIGSDKTSYAGRIILPETADRKIKIESFIQVLRSRCRLADKDVEAYRDRLLAQYPELA